MITYLERSAGGFEAFVTSRLLRWQLLNELSNQILQ